MVVKRQSPQGCTSAKAERSQSQLTGGHASSAGCDGTATKPGKAGVGLSNAGKLRDGGARARDADCRRGRKSSLICAVCRDGTAGEAAGEILNGYRDVVQLREVGSGDIQTSQELQTR